MSEPFADLPRGHFKAILADPPWHFQAWAGARKSGAGVPCRATERHYSTMREAEIASLPVSELAAPDCVLFMWACWPILPQSLRMLEAWGFTYKTCAFAWMKADVRQIDMFREDATADMMLGYWTRANSEFCLLGTRGAPKRKDGGVRQGIIEKAREHSRKPDCVHERIQRLVAGPYLELFGRQHRAGWTVWGNETDKFGRAAA